MKLDEITQEVYIKRKNLIFIFFLYLLQEISALCNQTSLN